MAIKPTVEWEKLGFKKGTDAIHCFSDDSVLAVMTKLRDDVRGNRFERQVLQFLLDVLNFSLSSKIVVQDYSESDSMSDTTVVFKSLKFE